VTRVRVPGEDAPGSIAGNDRVIWISNRDSHTVSRLDPETNRVVATIPVDGGPVIPAVASDGTVFVPNSQAGSLSRIDPASNSVVETIPMGGNPVIVRSAFGDLWVGAYGGGGRHLWRLRIG
jgi:virginiamycin B lyase